MKAGSACASWYATTSSSTAGISTSGTNCPPYGPNLPPTPGISLLDIHFPLQELLTQQQSQGTRTVRHLSVPSHRYCFGHRPAMNGHYLRGIVCRLPHHNTITT